MPRLLVTSAPLLEAARQQARLDARAAITARMNGLAWGGLAIEAARYSLPATLDELTSVALTATRWAAAALGADEADVLGALLTGRTAYELSDPPP